MSKQEFNVAACGLGVNTVAYLILCTLQGIKFDMILFSDPGKEQPETYKYIGYLNEWLVSNGQPYIQTLYQTFKGERLSIYDDNIRIKSLPSIVYGYKKCSQKFKIQPFEKYLNNRSDVDEYWKSGGIVNVFKGIDADEEHRAIVNPNKKLKNVYPLIESGFGRFECVNLILKTGLRLPPKSACTICPSMKPWEIIELYENNPIEFFDAINLERNAEENLTVIKGLGRDYSWWDLIVAYRYLKLVQKYKSMGNVPDKIKRLMSKVNRSKPVDYEKLSKERLSPKENVCELFKQSIDMPCECMN